MVLILKFYGVILPPYTLVKIHGLAKALGADKIIDYKTGDFTKDTEKYDFVFDAAGKGTFAWCKPLLKQCGVYMPSDGFLIVFPLLITPLFGGKKVIFPVSAPNQAGLSFIKGLVEKGHLRPVTVKTCPLNQIVGMYKYMATGKKPAMVIVTMDAWQLV